MLSVECSSTFNIQHSTFNLKNAPEAHEKPTKALKTLILFRF